MATNSELDFERYVHDANKYFKDLAEEFGHPEEMNRTFIAWRAVMHTFRDRIHVGESMDMMSQLPMILKGFYAENWKYHEKPPLNFSTMEEMVNEVEKRQEQYGEISFPWDISTGEVIMAIVDSLDPYLSKGQIKHLKSQMPKEVAEAMG